MSKPLTDDEILLLSKLQSRIDPETWRRLYECRPGDPDWPLAALPESRDTPTTGAGTAAYEEGYLHGLREYAHWKDGVQYVGTCGKTLADAIAEFKDERCMPSATGGAAGATTAAQET